MCFANLKTEQPLPRLVLDRGQVCERTRAFTWIWWCRLRSIHVQASTECYSMARSSDNLSHRWSAFYPDHRARTMLLSYRPCIQHTLYHLLALFVRCAGRICYDSALNRERGLYCGLGRCVLAACASLCLAPACITTVDFVRRYQLHALSSAGESAGSSPRLLVAKWLGSRCYYRRNLVLSRPGRARRRRCRR